MHPVKLINRLAGKKAQARGNEFELLVRSACRSHGVDYTHHPLGCRPFAKGRFHLISTGYDFTLFYDRQVCLIDAKAYSSTNFSKSKAVPHQVDALYNLELKGFRAGYLLYLRPLGKVYFIKASQLYYLKPRCSIQPEEMIFIGEIGNFNVKKIFDIPVDIGEMELISNE